MTAPPTTAAGGLVLRQNADIDMVSEDLFVSVEQIRVHYVFRNRAPRDVTVTVAFPMPDRDLSAMRESDVGYPSDFHTTRRRPAGRRATLERHVDARRPRPYRAAAAPPHPARARCGRHRPHRRRADRAAGRARAPSCAGSAWSMSTNMTRASGMERHFVPLWTVRDTWYWQQVFPAGRDLIVDHRYRPGAGSSAGTPLAFPDYRRSADGRAEAALYCADADFLASLDRLTRAGGEGTELPDYRIGYILTTGANWRSPIGDFRLVVDKGSPAQPGQLLREGVRRISPTQFEVRHRNWRPTRDLNVLIVQPDQ